MTNIERQKQKTEAFNQWKRSPEISALSALCSICNTDTSRKWLADTLHLSSEQIVCAAGWQTNDPIPDALKSFLDPSRNCDTKSAEQTLLAQEPENPYVERYRSQLALALAEREKAIPDLLVLQSCCMLANYAKQTDGCKAQLQIDDQTFEKLYRFRSGDDHIPIPPRNEISPASPESSTATRTAPTPTPDEQIAKKKIVILDVQKIRTDGGTQCRAAMNEETIGEYAELYRNGEKMPPLVVFYDGKNYWLADGFHRLEAAIRAGLKEISVEIHDGTDRDAKLFAVGANSSHGLPRTNADKRCSVRMMVTDQEWGCWSDREIARRCGVSNTFVGRIRAELLTNDSDSGQRLFQKSGKTLLMNTSAIGKSDSASTGKEQPNPLATEEPNSELQDTQQHGNSDNDGDENQSPNPSAKPSRVKPGNKAGDAGEISMPKVMKGGGKPAYHAALFGSLEEIRVQVGLVAASDKFEEFIRGGLLLTVKKPVTAKKIKTRKVKRK